ncbi:PLP-dependent transferase [Dendrothele bispora CBS 962.96]|uniref:PLP-dependent transferase n=1 Tax=Dendrothele bispora (strain CBS 962.96) TaxID=1314807 RepID=A0A4S8LP03_DENBC|nr:PLP-dependent transferase [Dendrothele bispora CBS 962.96]
MAPVATTTTSNDTADLKTLRPTSLIHRTPWIPPIATSAEGIYLTLEDGRTVIDAVGGAAVACIGGNNKHAKQAVKDQLDRLSYVYSMQLSNEPAERLAKILTSGPNNMFELVGFVSGGSEAVEGALKLGKQYFEEIGQSQRKNFIARQLSYHAHHTLHRVGYEGILDKQTFHHVSPAYAKRFQRPSETEEQYVARLKKELEDKFIELGPDTVIGFVAEPVSGATLGCVPAPKGYFKAMKEVCDKYGALFILDEHVHSGDTGMGTQHAWESFADGVAPDIQAVAKGLGGGYASIGAVLMSKKVADGIRGKSGIWKHGHTYQSHPLACAASIAVQEVIESENLLANCRKQGAYLEKLLNERLRGANALAAPYTFDIRGGGLFWGVEFDFDSPGAKKVDMKGKGFAMEVQACALENNMVIMGFTGACSMEAGKGNHVMLAPAYNITQEEVEKIVDVLVKSIEQVLKENFV